MCTCFCLKASVVDVVTVDKLSRMQFIAMDKVDSRALLPSHPQNSDVDVLPDLQSRSTSNQLQTCLINSEIYLLCHLTVWFMVELAVRYFVSYTKCVLFNLGFELV